MQRTAQLEAANKELEAFSYSVAHDLRAPLRHIDGFSDILVAEHAAQLGPEAVGKLLRVQEASRRMGRLIDDLLRLSRIARSEFQRRRTDLSKVVRSVVGELRTAEPNRQVEVLIQEEVTAECDEPLLRIVLQNLLRNAWKFTSRSPAPRVEFGSLDEGTPRACFVRDNGAGFDMAYANKLFGAFQRLHRAEEFEGNGIGLALVQRIVQRHGGRVWAEAEVGKGATFFFTV